MAYQLKSSAFQDTDGKVYPLGGGRPSGGYSRSAKTLKSGAGKQASARVRSRTTPLEARNARQAVRNRSGRGGRVDSGLASKARSII